MENRWSAEDVNDLDGLDLLVYQSRLIGEEASLVLWGGGNTSLKVTRSDFRGRQVKAMLVKGSGSDMKSALRRTSRLCAWTIFCLSSSCPDVR